MGSNTLDVSNDKEDTYMNEWLYVTAEQFIPTYFCWKEYIIKYEYNFKKYFMTTPDSWAHGN